MTLRDEMEALYARHAELLDEGPLAEWPSLFVHDGSYKAVTRENIDRGWPLALILCESRAAIEDRVYAIEHLAMKISRRVRHLVSGMAIAELGEAYTVRANFAVLETLEGEPTVCFAAGVYRDVVVRDCAGTLRFREKVSIADSPVIRNSLVFPL
ncbi:MAG: aromatic-ring-hydroxylating dioxygenase subunit beta [Caulobacteraceae bacterium]